MQTVINQVMEAEEAYHKQMIKAHSELLVKLERIKNGTYAQPKTETPKPAAPEIITAQFEMGQTVTLDGLQYVVTEPGNPYSVCAANIKDEKGHNQLRHVQVHNEEIARLIAQEVQNAK